MYESLICSVKSQPKLKESFLEIQDYIETSYNNIDTYLDSILSDTSDSIDIQSQTSLQTQSPTYFIEMPQINQEPLKFHYDLSPQLSPIIEIKIKTQVLLKEQYIKYVQFQKIKQFQQLFKQEMEQQKSMIKRYLENISREMIKQYQEQYLDIQQQPVNKLQAIASTSYQQSIIPFRYQLMEEYSITQNEWCHAIAIDQDCSTLVVACESKIKVFEFNQGQLKQIQILSGHQNWINTLNFMKQSNYFISGSQDFSIIIWEKNNNNNNQWIIKQILHEHSGSIFCLVINNNDDLIVSGSSDKSIKFWNKSNEWECYQTIRDHSNSVRGLSINQQQNKLISCSGDCLILIMEKQKLTKLWIVIQKIIVEQYGNRICFIENDIFTFQQIGKEQMSVFEMNSLNKLYTKTKDIAVKCGSASGDISLYPQQYIHQKCLLVNRNGEYINLIRKTQDENFVLEQSILFETTDIFGSMTINGEYLITWDKKSKQIQVRQYTEQQ